MKKMTHSGVLRPHWTKPYRTEFRETKNFWVDKTGCKFRKSNGYPAGDYDWTPTVLDLNSIREL